MTSKSKPTPKDGSASFNCKYCHTDKEEDFYNMKTLCERCRSIVKAVKVKEGDREKRHGIIKNIMQEFKTLDERDEITYSEVTTGTLLEIANTFKGLKESIAKQDKTIEKLKKEIDKLKSK